MDLVTIWIVVLASKEIKILSVLLVKWLRMLVKMSLYSVRIMKIRSAWISKMSNLMLSLWILASYLASVALVPVPLETAPLAGSSTALAP